MMRRREAESEMRAVPMSDDSVRDDPLGDHGEGDQMRDDPGSGGRLWNPYAAGVALGGVLLASFLVTGQGLGASGGVARLLAAGLKAIAPDWNGANRNFGSFFAGGANPLANHLVLLSLGVLLGGYLGAMTGGRLRFQMERGPRAGIRGRAVSALAGGAIMGFAARLAYGCTSGQALSGGATQAAGSWAFMMCVFGGGYAVAWFVRRQWT